MRAWVPDWKDAKNNHFFLQWNCEGSTGFLYYLRGKKATICLILRTAALRLEIILIGIITSWFEFFGCCLSRAGKQICTPCNKLLTAMTLRKSKVWSLLAGEGCLFASLSPNWRKGAHKLKLQKKSKKWEPGFPYVTFQRSVDMHILATLNNRSVRQSTKAPHTRKLEFILVCIKMHGDGWPLLHLLLQSRR